MPPSSRMPKPVGAAIGLDTPVVGDEIVERIFRRDPALQRMAVEPDLRLRGHAGLRRAQSPPMAMRICAFTMSMPVTTSVTVCSTWMRGFTSMK